MLHFGVEFGLDFGVCLRLFGDLVRIDSCFGKWIVTKFSCNSP